ncbi:MAG: ATP-dependent DNA helicase RecG [Oscillospiraceae bacterium]|nr:ATP-dependent DNA helicase RecG [Oscillospiraceae bacterium]
MTNMFKPIKILKGVADKRAGLYENLGIYTPFDLLHHFPRNYIDYENPISINEAKINENNVVAGVVLKKVPEQRIRQGLSIYKVLVTDGIDNFYVVFYNNIYAQNALNEGEEYVFYGKVTFSYSNYEMNSPQYISRDSGITLKPVYHLTAGLTNTMLCTNIRDCLKIFESESYEFMPEDILRDNNLCSLEYALKNIHFPSDRSALEKARKRLIFNELLNLQLGMRMLRERNAESKAGFVMDSSVDIEKFLGDLPFKMTNAQRSATLDIIGDMCCERPMNRLLQGDVGSGKTAVAAAACYFCAANSCQAALMAPTEILATQHYKTLSAFLVPFGIKVCLLTGSVSAKQKSNIKSDIALGEYDVIVGTHAIIQKDTQFKNLALVITDEQHRFGVAQRNALAVKGNSPHRLVMSATPIPRTLAMMIYGDLDISVINELPAGRIPIETYAVTGGYRDRIYEFIRKHINNGRQAYIVCTVIEQNETDLKSAVEYKDKLSDTVFKEFNVGLLHGKMSAKEKDDIMNEFKEGRIDIMVSTTVIEVGVDVPNAVVMMIEDADRFGLSQLHQLRGRVGRGREKSYCVLVTENHSQEAKKRMKIISSLSDGFKISEEDLKLRGPGDFFGHRQHGLPCLKIADMTDDFEVFERTRDIAHQIISEDSRLISPKYQGLRGEVQRLFASAEE